LRDLAINLSFPRLPSTAICQPDENFDELHRLIIK